MGFGIPILSFSFLEVRVKRFWGAFSFEAGDSSHTNDPPCFGTQISSKEQVSSIPQPLGTLHMILSASDNSLLTLVQKSFNIGSNQALIFPMSILYGFMTSSLKRSLILSSFDMTISGWLKSWAAHSRRRISQDISKLVVWRWLAL